MSEEAKSEKNVVQSLAKGFQVLQAFTSDEPELVLADVARRAPSTRAPPSACSIRS